MITSWMARQKMEIHKSTITFVVVILLGALTPLWAGMFIDKFLNKWQGFSMFWSNGELYLYSTAIYTHAIYLLFQNKRKNYDMQAVLGWLSLVCLLLSAVAYSTLLTTLRELAEETNINGDFLFYTSCFFFIFSIIVFYISIYIENEKSFNVVDEEKNEINSIMDKIN